MINLSRRNNQNQAILLDLARLRPAVFRQWVFWLELLLSFRILGKFGGRPFVLVPDPSHGICPWDRWEADDYVEKTMQNDASHLSAGESKAYIGQKNKNMKFGTLNCPESGQISSYRGLRGTIRRRKMRSFF